jgi:hypothetical protein
MTENYPWYSIVEGGDIRQGDLVFDCPVIVPSNATLESDAQKGATLEAEILTYDVVIMSQSCDLENEKLELVLVCPHWRLKEFGDQQEYFKSTKGKTDLQRGNIPGYHLLNRCDLNDWLPDLRVVDFRNVYGLPYRYLKQLCGQRGPRLRLLPPYREHLSQAFARFFMRVGLPTPVNVDGK